MSVLIVAFNVVVKLITVEEKYPGGAKQYAADCPNLTYCQDEHLTRIGFMSLDDAEAFAYKLRQTHKFATEDIAFVDHGTGILAPRDWLEYSPQQDGAPACWLKGIEPGQLVVPKGWKEEWTRDLAKVCSAPVNDLDGLEFLRHEDGIDVYRDKVTGQLRYVGRVDSGIAPEEILRRYEQGCNLIKPFSHLTDQPRNEISPTDKQDILRGIDYLRQAIAIKEDSWRAMWVIGKAYEALDDNENALDWFEQACRFDHNNSSVFREAFVQCFKLGLGEKAEHYALSALELQPNDPELMGNYAIGLLLNHKPQQAKTIAQKACESNPEDSINQNILRMINVAITSDLNAPSEREVSATSGNPNRNHTKSPSNG